MTKLTFVSKIAVNFIYSKEEGMNAMELGRQVQIKRREKNLSQTELGDLVGISRNYVSLIERGEAENISMKIVNQLAVALGASPSELTGESLPVMISLSLREFALEQNLSYEVIDKLARIPRRGKEPQTAKEWKILYDLISKFMDSGGA
ncbi:MAG TPA: helix-turn-helix transcriptional regulator [Anaerolineales bacterium]|nr:helix-turn-helix transcriptional regulator [Anaerolineales bacterium]